MLTNTNETWQKFLLSCLFQYAAQAVAQTGTNITCSHLLFLNISTFLFKVLTQFFHFLGVFSLHFLTHFCEARNVSTLHICYDITQICHFNTVLMGQSVHSQSTGRERCKYQTTSLCGKHKINKITFCTHCFASSTQA